jgi:hypothetical protein
MTPPALESAASGVTRPLEPLDPLALRRSNCPMSHRNRPARGYRPWEAHVESVHATLLVQTFKRGGVVTEPPDHFGRPLPAP